MAISFNNLIKKKINPFVGIEEFAFELNTNSKKLTSISKKFLLDTPGNVIKKRKILEAKRMLANQKFSIKSGEYILLEEEEIVEGIRMPKVRKWYWNKNNEYIGTDTLIKSEPLTYYRI